MLQSRRLSAPFGLNYFVCRKCGRAQKTAVVRSQDMGGCYNSAASPLHRLIRVDKLDNGNSQMILAERNLRSGNGLPVRIV